MSVQPSSLWKKLVAFDMDILADNRQQLHQAIQNVSAVGRTFLPPSDSDVGASLIWDSNLSRIVGQWVQGGIKFRSSLHPETFTIHLVDASVTSMASYEVSGKKQGMAMVWLEEQLTRLELNTKTLTLDKPYELPIYPQAKGAPFTPDKDAQIYLSSLFHNAWLILLEIIRDHEGFGPPAIWPHHFDANSLHTVKDTGDFDTSASVGIGMSPGDENFAQPYFYVNAWPYPDVQELEPLPCGEWYDDEWVGATLKLEEVIAAGDESSQYRLVHAFFMEAIKILRATIK